VAVHRGAIRELHLRILQCVFSLHLRPGALGQVVVRVAKLGTWRPFGNSLRRSLYSSLVEHFASGHVANFGSPEEIQGSRGVISGAVMLLWLSKSTMPFNFL